VADSWLHEAVCRQRPELWLTVGYMKLCVDRDRLLVIVGYMKLCRQRPTVGFYFVTVMYFKSLYSSQAATLANSGNISGQIL